MEYMVLSVGDLDRQVFDLLCAQGAARPVEGKPQAFEISDVEKARSQNILPQVLDRYGGDGWRLCGVNKMECCIFSRPRRVQARKRYAYKVMTPADLDREALAWLSRRNAVSVVEGEVTALEVSDLEQARIQVVLPQVLSKNSR